MAFNGDNVEIRLLPNGQRVGRGRCHGDLDRSNRLDVRGIKWEPFHGLTPVHFLTQSFRLDFGEQRHLDGYFDRNYDYGGPLGLPTALPFVMEQHWGFGR